MKKVSGNIPFLIGLGASVVFVILLLVQSTEPAGTVGIILLAIFPLLISTLISLFLSKKSARILSTVGIVAFILWFLFYYMMIFYWEPDPQAAIGLLYLGIVSLPVMIPIWIITLVLNRRKTLPTEPVHFESKDS